MNWSELSFITPGWEQMKRLMGNRHCLFILGCHCPHSPCCPFLAEGNPVQPAPGWLKTPSKVGAAGTQHVQGHSLTLELADGGFIAGVWEPCLKHSTGTRGCFKPLCKDTIREPHSSFCHWCVLGVWCSPKAQVFEGVKCGGLKE